MSEESGAVETTVLGADDVAAIVWGLKTLCEVKADSDRFFWLAERIARGSLTLEAPTVEAVAEQMGMSDWLKRRGGK